MKISHGLEYVAIWSLTGLVRLMPALLVDYLAVALGKLSYVILISRRRIAFDNLERAFKGEKNHSELKAMVKQVFVNIARATLEFARFPVLKREDIMKMVYKSEGLEHIDKALKEGKGLVFVTGHFGNWELLGAWFVAMGYPTHFLVGEQHNPYVDKLMNKFRASSGVPMIPVGVSARHVLKALKQNRVVVLVSDQHSATGGTAVTFFGRLASTPKGAAAFAEIMGSPIVLALLIREKYNRHRAVIGPLIYPPGSGDKDKDITAMTQEYTSQLEAMIRKHPEQWMWTHRRWKVDHK